MLEEGPGVNFPFRGLIEDSTFTLRRCECTVQHTMEEGNLCADAMAKLGAEQPVDLLVVNEPPEETRSMLVADMVGRSRERA
ncbi:unnamed protein product [Camellia sinensis]